LSAWGWLLQGTLLFFLTTAGSGIEKNGKSGNVSESKEKMIEKEMERMRNDRK